MKKRWLSLVLVGAMTCSLVMGCGNASTTTQENESAASENASVKAAGENEADDSEVSAADDKVISFWHVGTDDPDFSVFERAVEQFNQNTASGYTIECTAVEADAYKEKIQIAMSSGECPDMYTHWSGGPMNEYVDAGLAQPIEDLYEAASWKDKVMSSDIEQGKYNGHLYAIGMLNISVSGIFYNKEIFDKYNLEVPATLGELEQVCDTLVSNGVVPFALANAEKWTGSMYFMNLATRKGGLEPFKKAVDGSGSFEDECFVWAGQKIQEWVQKGYFPEGVNSLSEADGQSKQIFYTEEAAMKLMGSWDVGNYRADSIDFYNKVGWFPFPAVEGSNADPSIMIGTVGDSFISFNCEGEKLAAAFELFDYYFAEDYIQSSVDAGKLIPVNNINELLSEDQGLEKVILEKAGEASDTQLWYDQYLPPAVAQAHLNSCQELFGLTMTPEEAAKVFQDAMNEYLESK